MSKFIWIIFLPVVLSVSNDQLIESFHTVDELNNQLANLTSPSTPDSVILMLTTTRVVCINDSKIDDIKPNKRDDYQYTSGIGAHKLHTRGTTFNKARKICIEEGGHLAIINSIVEEQILLNLFKHASKFVNADDKLAYIGIHDLYEEGDWVTIFGEPLSTTGYSKWSQTWLGYVQPNNAEGGQNCGTILKQGGINDVNCNHNFAFICEIPEI